MMAEMNIMQISERIYDMMLSDRSLCRACGIRCDECVYNVGAELECSKDYNDDIPEDEWDDLPGTCATGIGMLFFLDHTRSDDIQTIADAIKYNKEFYRCSHQYFISGWDSQYGVDPREVIISDAEVVLAID